jgi:hypothetical protein
MLRALSSIIFPEVVLTVAESTAGQGVLILKEDDDASKIKKLKIMDVGEKSFAFTLDHKVNKTDKKVPCFKQLSSYFHPENDVGINKGCDLVLFTQFRDVWYALVLDMKSDRPDRAATERQLQNSELFAKYVCSLANAYYPDAESLAFRYMKTYTTTNMRKNGVYQARKQPSVECLSVSVEVNDHQEASVHLGKLLGQ